MAKGSTKQAGEQKSPALSHPATSQATPAGEDAVRLTPPAYGIQMADTPPLPVGTLIQRSAAPAALRDHASGAPPPNRTGLPDALKSGVEALAGISMDDVRVHFNSPRPAQLQALAYTQGTEIHVAPGQTRHLPHEAWHVVQQKQGRVRATMQLKGTAINDDAGLEREADVMGSRASQLNGSIPTTATLPAQEHSVVAVQRSAPARVSAPIPAGGNSYRLIAGAGGHQVGSVMVHARGEAAIEVTDLGVDQAHREQGLGTQLIASAARTGMQMGKAKMALAAQDNGSGRLTQWYKRMGFAQVGVHPSGYPQLEAPIGRVLGGVAQRKEIHHQNDLDRPDTVVFQKRAFITHRPRRQPANQSRLTSTDSLGRGVFQAMEMPKQDIQRVKVKIFPFGACIFRVQNPKDTERGGSETEPKKSKVSETEWNATQGSVDNTISNYYNRRGHNEKLWLRGIGGLKYVNIDVGFPHWTTSQAGLDDESSIVTIILPTAFEPQEKPNLELVSPSFECTSAARLEVNLFGLKGKLSEEGRLWIPFSIFKECAEEKSILYFKGLDNQFYGIDFSKRDEKNTTIEVDIAYPYFDEDV